MRIINDLTFTREGFPSPAVTIGNYDGLHLGHKEIIKRVTERAKAHKSEAVLITFEPHPATILYPKSDLRLITPYHEKMMLLERFGIDVTINLPFTRALAEMPARRFIKEIIYEKINPCCAVVGFNFTFGREREGTASVLLEMGKALGFEVEVVPPHTVDHEVVSSTRIRELLIQGDIKKANQMLGRAFTIYGKVIHGHSRGKGLGFPTANLESTQELRPAQGVYAVSVTLGEETHGGTLNIGTNPTFGNKELAIEVFVFDYHGDLYGRELKVALVDRIRDERSFPTSEALVSQIKDDIKRAQEVLGKR